MAKNICRYFSLTFLAPLEKNQSYQCTILAFRFDKMGFIFLGGGDSNLFMYEYVSMKCALN